MPRLGALVGNARDTTGRQRRAAPSERGKGKLRMATRALKRSSSLDGLPLTAYASGLPAELTEISIARTLQQLELRKLERRRTGTLRL
jgi:hypothetical protein